MSEPTEHQRVCPRCFQTRTLPTWSCAVGVTTWIRSIVHPFPRQVLTTPESFFERPVAQLFQTLQNGLFLGDVGLCLPVIRACGAVIRAKAVYTS